MPILICIVTQKKTITSRSTGPRSLEVDVFLGCRYFWGCGGPVPVEWGLSGLESRNVPYHVPHRVVTLRITQSSYFFIVDGRDGCCFLSAPLLHATDEGLCRQSNVVLFMVMRSSKGHHDVVACCQCGWTLPVDTSPVGSVVVLVPNGILVASM